jgi:hypothetical protein
MIEEDIQGDNRERGHGGFFAKIYCRDYDYPWRYYFREVITEINNGVIEFVPGQEDNEGSFIMNGTTYLQAEEANKNQNVPFGAVVWMCPGVDWDDENDIPHIEYRFRYDAPVWAIITGQGKESPGSEVGNGQYSWREVIRDEWQINPDWVYAPYGRSSNPQIAVGNTLHVMYPAREINVAEVPSGTIVQLFPSVPDGSLAFTNQDACTEINSQEWIFSYTAPLVSPIPCELYDDIEQGKNGEVYIRELQDNGTYKTNNDEHYPAQDQQNVIKGYAYGRNTMQGSYEQKDGAFGWMMLSGDYYTLVNCEAVAPILYGVLEDTLETTDDEITVKTLSTPFGQLPPTETIEALNRHKHAAESGALVTMLLKMVDNLPRYSIVQIDCPPEE